jgi:hypothetical protein
MTYQNFMIPYKEMTALSINNTLNYTVNVSRLLQNSRVIIITVLLVQPEIR